MLAAQFFLEELSIKAVHLRHLRLCFLYIFKELPSFLQVFSFSQTSNLFTLYKLRVHLQNQRMIEE
jgi:hypothetical protein